MALVTLPLEDPLLQLSLPFFASVEALLFSTSAVIDMLIPYHLLLHLVVRSLSLRLNYLHTKGTYSGCSEVTCVN